MIWLASGHVLLGLLLAIELRRAEVRIPALVTLVVWEFLIALTLTYWLAYLAEWVVSRLTGKPMAFFVPHQRT